MVLFRLERISPVLYEKAPDRRLRYMAQSKANANCLGGVLYEIRKGGRSTQAVTWKTSDTHLSD